VAGLMATERRCACGQQQCYDARNSADVAVSHQWFSLRDTWRPHLGLPKADTDSNTETTPVHRQYVSSLHFRRDQLVMRTGDDSLNTRTVKKGELPSIDCGVRHARLGYVQRKDSADVSGRACVCGSPACADLASKLRSLSYEDKPRQLRMGPTAVRYIQKLETIPSSRVDALLGAKRVFIMSHHFVDATDEQGLTFISPNSPPLGSRSSAVAVRSVASAQQALSSVTVFVPVTSGSQEECDPLMENKQDVRSCCR
jgi:hypothetical protein